MRAVFPGKPAGNRRIRKTPLPANSIASSILFCFPTTQQSPRLRRAHCRPPGYRQRPRAHHNQQRPGAQAGEGTVDGKKQRRQHKALRDGCRRQAPGQLAEHKFCTDCGHKVSTGTELVLARTPIFPGEKKCPQMCPQIHPYPARPALAIYILGKKGDTGSALRHRAYWEVCIKGDEEKNVDN